MSSSHTVHVLQWISSKVKVQIALTLLCLHFNFGVLRMHRFVQDIYMYQYHRMSTCQNLDNNSCIPALQYSKDIGNSKLIRSQTALRMVVYGS